MTTAGLRERKQAATRANLSRAAWSMMLEHGLASVTPESVAASADMAPRTFRYHFRSREEAILDGLAQQHAVMVDRIRARPGDEPIWTSLLQVLPTSVAEICGSRTEFAELIRVITGDASMLAENLLVLERTRALLAQVVGERTGIDPHRDAYPGLLAGAAVMAIGQAVSLWVAADESATVSALLHDCLTQLRAGLPAPVRSEH